MARFLIQFVSILILIPTYSSLLYAQDNQQLLGKLQLISADKVKREKAQHIGQERALICSYCHGEDGNSVKPDVPNLASQNPTYLLEQINHFANGVRKDFVMNSLAKKFTEEDMINLALYYASKKVKPGTFDPRFVSKGKIVYSKHCQSCHGQNGKGNASFARLAGQKQTYIVNTLHRFRANARNQSNKTKRTSPLMESIVTPLSDSDIQSVAAYVSSLR